MGFFDIFKSGQTVAETVGATIDSVGNLADRFIQTKEEKDAFQLALKEFALKERAQAMDADMQILQDRQSARVMASTHGKLQTVFAIVFLIGFLLTLLGALFFIGLIVRWTITGTQSPIPEWAQVLISSTVSGVLGYMASMVKEIVGFLFGGSASGDESHQQLSDMVRSNTTHINGADVKDPG